MLFITLQHHGLKEIRKAAKKAKTFETQKLVKKLKGLRSDPPPIIRLPLAQSA